MQRLKSLGKDHLGGVLLIALGAAVLAMGVTYKMGSLNRMGAGYIPVVLGVLMILVGIAIGVTAAPAGKRVMVNPLPGHGAHGNGIDVRGWLCILGGVVGFVVLGAYGGLMPATFASVFISAMGDRNNTYKGAAVLAAVLTVFCLVVFHFGLSLQLPLFQWGG
jgi:hypothetical protein